MRKSMLMPLVFMALCLMAADLATAAGGPASDQKSSFQAQQRAQTVAQSRIIMRLGAFRTTAPIPRRGIHNVNHDNNCSIMTGYDSCQHWFDICVEAADKNANVDHCYNIFKDCENHCGRYNTNPLPGGPFSQRMNRLQKKFANAPITITMSSHLLFSPMTPSLHGLRDYFHLAACTQAIKQKCESERLACWEICKGKKIDIYAINSCMEDCNVAANFCPQRYGCN